MCLSCLLFGQERRGLVAGSVVLVGIAAATTTTTSASNHGLLVRVFFARSDADFILLVEKEAAYMRMAEDRFYQKYPCIVITAKGQPVRKPRTFVRPGSWRRGVPYINRFERGRESRGTGIQALEVPLMDDFDRDTVRRFNMLGSWRRGNFLWSMVLTFLGRGGGLA